VYLSSEYLCNIYSETISPTAFILNYIPTVGGALSIVAPVVICILDPDKTVGDIMIVFIVPGLSHILCGKE
jgi:predicted PurR-regulated permease PerM